MIAFGASITVPDVYERCAARGFGRAAEPDSLVFADAAAGSVARSYNLILDQASPHDDLEALVLVHQDVEILDSQLGAKLREVLSDSDVAVVGCVGATGVGTIAWWQGAVSWTSSVIQYGELGGGTLAPPSLSGDALPPQAPPGEVEMLYGMFLALSPWAVRHLRFDESIGPQHGYDFDLCRRARAAGRKVVAADLEVAHHHSLELVDDFETWAEAHIAAADRWEGEGQDEDGLDGWKGRARRAEAEAAAARLQAASKLLQAYARAQEQDDRITEIEDSTSWRMTAPLRQVKGLRASSRQRPRRRRADAGVTLQPSSSGPWALPRARAFVRRVRRPRGRRALQVEAQSGPIPQDPAVSERDSRG